MADETPETEQTTDAAKTPAAPKLSGKEERARRDHLAKSQRGPRTTAERDAERRELRKAKAAARTRRRAQEKSKRAAGAAASEVSGASDARNGGTPPAEHGTGTPQVRLGKVVSDKADKTITVRIDIAKRHRRYRKIVRSSSTLHAHDERNDANEGDLVRVVECRPMSRTKRWRLVEILERAR